MINESLVAQVSPCGVFIQPIYEMACCARRGATSTNSRQPAPLRLRGTQRKLRAKLALISQKIKLADAIEYASRVGKA
jgi:hypothetical protein